MAIRWAEIAQVSEMTVKGNAKTPPYFKATLKESSPYVEFLHSNGESLRIIFNFQPGDIVEADCKKEKVYINKELKMPAIDLMKADFFYLKPGYNRIATIPAMDLETKYTEKWL